VKIHVSAKNQAHAFECEPGEKILHAGLRNGIALPYECGTGTCGTCKAKLVGGDVSREWPGAPGHKYLRNDDTLFLMCQGIARADCTLEVTSAVNAMALNAFLPVAVGAVIRRSTMLTHDVVALELTLDRPIDFEAGQFVLMSVAGIAGARAYSMVNFDRRAERLAFVVKRKPDGRLSDWLFGGPITGARVDLFGPLGGATFHPEIGKNLLCIAGGSGIAGMMSILSRACQERYFEDHTGHVFFGVRTRRDVFFLDEMHAFLEQAGDALRVVVALSDEDVDPELVARYPRFGWDKGFVHAVAGEGMKGRFEDVRAYTAGPPPMVDATLRMLLREGKLTAENIRYDKFS
jgi:toluene monooxygenase electron transfer component